MPQVEWFVSSMQVPAGGTSLSQNRVSPSPRKRLAVSRPTSHSLPAAWVLVTNRGSQLVVLTLARAS